MWIGLKHFAALLLRWQACDVTFQERRSLRLPPHFRQPCAAPSLILSGVLLKPIGSCASMFVFVQTFTIRLFRSICWTHTLPSSLLVIVSRCLLFACQS